jgi:D-amino-acid dehydrogenase
VSEPSTADVIVLGAGMVGVSTALHLQKRGLSVVLVDRRGAGEETSYGNTGIIQREGVVPYPFPRNVFLMAQYALNMRSEANLHWSALPKIAPYLFRYWQASTAEGVAQTARGARPLIERCVIEHEALMQEAGIVGMMRRTGYLRLYRSEQTLAAETVRDEAWRKTYGVKYEVVDARKLAELEPHLRGPAAGGVWMPEPVSVADPGGVTKAYAKLFTDKGGRFLEGDARSLAPLRGGWQVRTSAGPISAASAVVALGPWSDDVLRPLGFNFPLGVKRGYHMHFKAEGNATLNRPLIDIQYGFALTPTVKGIRLTTGAEFALRDAPPTPVQLAKAEPLAREIFPLGARVDPEPWLGRRPCLPDMLPIVGRASMRHENLWLNFGHHHLGFTMGPVTGRLLAEMLTGEAPFTDPQPYSSSRF